MEKRFIILTYPRHGSNYFGQLLGCHHNIGVAQELLNQDTYPEIAQMSKRELLEHLDNELSKTPEKINGIKVFPDHLQETGITLPELCRHLGATYIIALWRSSAIDAHVSAVVAEATGTWYSETEAENPEPVRLEKGAIASYCAEYEQKMKSLCEEWPLELPTIFVNYEILRENLTAEMERVFRAMSLETYTPSYKVRICRQNPFSLDEKVSNYNDLDSEDVAFRLDLEKLVRDGFRHRLHLSLDDTQIIPETEPAPPKDGWTYSVAEPYFSRQCRTNVIRALDSRNISSASVWTKKLNHALQEAFQSPVAQCCSNGFSALVLALQCCGVSEGDEVIVPAMTMVAVSNAVVFVRATPVFADCDEDSYNPEVSQIAEVATTNTKAVIVTHTYGVPCRTLNNITRLCERNGWFLIEDISECCGIETHNESGERRLLGTFGDFACASLYANKLVHGGDGGFVLAKDRQMRTKLSSFVNHGFTAALHFVHFNCALNAKINGLGAAFATGCIGELSEIMNHRAEITKEYRRHLHNVVPLELMPTAGCDDTPWVFSVLCDNALTRNSLRNHLAVQGIETRNFFFPLHMEPCNLQFRQEKHLPHAERLSSLGLYLPTHSNLTQADVSFICEQVRSYFDEAKRSEQQTAKPPNRDAHFGIDIDLSGQIHTEVYDANGKGYPWFETKQLLKDILSFGRDAAHALKEEKWDICTELLTSYNQLCSQVFQLEDCRMEKALKNVGVFARYFETLVPYERFGEAPWLNLQNPLIDESVSRKIYTTTDPELVKCVVWAIETYNVRNIVEFGSWFGFMTVVMAKTASRNHSDAKVIAVDNWEWRAWMNQFGYLENPKRLQAAFEVNTKDLEQHVIPVNVDMLRQPLPASVTNAQPDLVFFDFTNSGVELETVWSQVVGTFTPHKTLIVINTINIDNLPFLTKRCNVLKPLAKPRTNAKIYLFVGKEDIGVSRTATIQRIAKPSSRRSIAFCQQITWNHHHLTPFKAAIDKLAEEVGSPSGRFLFLPCVEEYFCEQPVPIDPKPWIGIIHSIPHTDFFYVPDLYRICTSWRYADWLRLCRGMVVLTKMQEDYLKHHLPAQYKFPIMRLKLPSIGPEETVSGQGPQLSQVSKNEVVNLVHIGAYARDLDFFQQCQVPSNFKKVLLVGDEDMRRMIEHRQFTDDIEVRNRVDETEYEALLRESVPMLCLKHDGAANVLLGECIVRNVPILAPRMNAVMEYIGEDYPLLYDPSNDNLRGLLTAERIESAVNYLRNKDKMDLTITHFCESFKQSVIVQAAPVNPTVLDDQYCKPYSQLGTSFDVAISIACFRRTHHLKRILDMLWARQVFDGTLQIILWNNNPNRSGTVKGIAEKYMSCNSDKRYMEVIDSSFNHFCAVRFALPQLVRSECVLICDDDILPGEDFISFFFENHKKHPEDILCVRGHYFLPHELVVANPAQPWEDYSAVRFADDYAPERLIHYVHADACLLTVQCLRECASVPLPDNDFRLVDDYWMSYVANHKFGRDLRKLQITPADGTVLTRTEDSDSEEIALHKNPGTKAAQLRMYIHHMSHGWPKWKDSPKVPFSDARIKRSKQEPWESGFVGFNVSSHVSDLDIDELQEMGVRVVRVGAVGCREDKDQELSALTTNPRKEVDRLSERIERLGTARISVVLTLHRICTPELWKTVAEKLGPCENVIAYDVINEPFTEEECTMHWAELEETQRNDGHKHIEDNYIAIIKAIREVDSITPIAVESSFWAHYSTMKFLDVSVLQKVAGDNLILSIHCYHPRLLTHNALNKGRFSFPGILPIYDTKNQYITHEVNDRYIEDTINEAAKVAQSHGVKLFVGEAGISRCVAGADLYLKSLLGTCKRQNIPVCVFGFRDMFSDLYDYELGPDRAVGSRFQPEAVQGNKLMKTVREFVMSSRDR